MGAVNVVEARKRFSDLMLRVAYGKQRIVVERHGKPMMALVSIQDLRRLEELESQAARNKSEGLAALDAASRLRERILAERGGVPMPGSGELIDEMREERLDELGSRD